MPCRDGMGRPFVNLCIIQKKSTSVGANQPQCRFFTGEATAYMHIMERQGNCFGGKTQAFGRGHAAALPPDTTAQPSPPQGIAIPPMALHATAPDSQKALTPP